MAAKMNALGFCLCSGSDIVCTKYSLKRKYFLNGSCSKNEERLKRLRGRLKIIMPSSKLKHISFPRKWLTFGVVMIVEGIYIWNKTSAGIAEDNN